MTASRFSLPRTADRPLAFEGEQLAEVSGRLTAGKENNRWHVVRVFRTRGGRYVVAISYCSQWQGETGVDYAEHADNAQAIVDILRSHDPIQDVQGYPPGEHYIERQTRLMATVRRQWDTAVAELFEELGPDFAETID